MRPWILKSGLLVAATLLSLAFAECAVRWLMPQELSIWSGRQDGLFVLQPGRRLESPRWGHEIVVNRLGFRGPEPRPHESADRPRLLVLGDSFIEAGQVAWSDSVSSRLAEALERRGRPAEVLSAGVSGWGTDDVVQYLATDGMALEPDVILIVVTLYNDVLDNLGQTFHRLEDGRLVHHDGARLDDRSYLDLRIKSFLSGHFHLYQLLRGVMRQGATGQAFSSLQDHWVDLLRAPLAPRIEQGFRLTEALLDEATRLADAHDARLAVVLIPMEEQLGEERAHEFLARHDVERRSVDLEGPQRRLSDWGRRSGVDVIDLLDPFRGHELGGGAPLYLENDGHWNERGHALAAAVVADELMARHLLDPPGRAVR